MITVRGRSSALSVTLHTRADLLEPQRDAVWFSTYGTSSLGIMLSLGAKRPLTLLLLLRSSDSLGLHINEVLNP